VISVYNISIYNSSVSSIASLMFLEQVVRRGTIIWPAGGWVELLSCVLNIEKSGIDNVKIRFGIYLIFL
jgi:hypothetical protein